MKKRITMKKILITGVSMVIAVQMAGQQPIDYLLKARALIESGKNNEAIHLLSDAISKGDDSRYFVFRGDAYTAAGRYEDAVKDYNYANMVEPSSGDYGLARIYAFSGNASKSLGYLESCLKSKYKRSEKEIMLDPAFTRIENSPLWRQFWKTDRYSIPETKIQEIEFYISAGKKNDAREIASKLIKEYPSGNESVYAKALVDFSFQHYQEVISAMSKLLVSEKNNTDYLILLAKSQLASGNAAGAAYTYTKIVDAGTLNPELFLRRAECFIKTGEYNRAAKDIDRYLDLYPDSKEALRMAGKTAVEAGDNLKAISFFTRNIELDPGDPVCFINRADSYFTGKSWELAVNDYSMALDIKPDIPEAWLNKGIALINLGNTDDACFNFRKALSLGNKKASPLISRYCIR
ncbi:MAG: tetratricopeptide repeat protein [Bacteroidales bacterium]